jgi:hypothetical protein
MLRRISGPKDKIRLSEKFRTLHNEEFCHLLRSPSTVRVVQYWQVRWGRHVTSSGEITNAYFRVAGKPVGKESPGRLKRVPKIIFRCLLGNLTGLGWLKTG